PAARGACPGPRPGRPGPPRHRPGRPGVAGPPRRSLSAATTLPGPSAGRSPAAGRRASRPGSFSQPSRPQVVVVLVVVTALAERGPRVVVPAQEPPVVRVVDAAVDDVHDLDPLRRPVAPGDRRAPAVGGTADQGHVLP